MNSSLPHTDSSIFSTPCKASPRHVPLESKHVRVVNLVSLLLYQVSCGVWCAWSGHIRELGWNLWWSEREHYLYARLVKHRVIVREEINHL